MTDFDWNNYSLETQAIRAGHARTHEDEHSIPIFATSSYVFKSAEEAALINSVNAAEVIAGTSPAQISTA